LYQYYNIRRCLFVVEEEVALAVGAGAVAVEVAAVAGEEEAFATRAHPILL
jgi:hypothetical protein